MEGMTGVVEASAVSLTLVLLVMMNLIDVVGLAVEEEVKNLHAGVLDEIFGAAVTFGRELTIITSRTVIYRIVVLVNNM